MKITIKDKSYETGRLVIAHAMEAMILDKKNQKGEISELEVLYKMIEILAESLINGTEKIPYDEITLEKKEAYSKLIINNFSMQDINPIYAFLVSEMAGNTQDDSGK